MKSKRRAKIKPNDDDDERDGNQTRRKFTEDELGGFLRRKNFRRPGSAHTEDLRNEHLYLKNMRARLKEEDPLLKEE